MDLSVDGVHGSLRRSSSTESASLSFLFKSCGLGTLPCDFVPHNYETLKWLSLLRTLMQKSFWCDSVAIGI